MSPTSPKERARRLAALAAKKAKKYVPPLVRSTRLPVPSAQLSHGCNPGSCPPQSCPPPGPCGPWR